MVAYGTLDTLSELGEASCHTLAVVLAIGNTHCGTSYADRVNLGDLARSRLQMTAVGQELRTTARALVSRSRRSQLRRNSLEDVRIRRAWPHRALEHVHMEAA